MNQLDLEAFVEREDIKYLGLDFLDRPDGTRTSFDEVFDYLRARHVVAGVAEGDRFGSPSAVVANLAVLADDKVAVQSGATGFAGGQDAEAFLPGLAYSLRTSIVMNDEVVFEPSGDVVPWNEDEEKLGTDRSLHLLSSDSPAPAYLSLLEQDVPGSYGYVADRVFFTPPVGVTTLSTVTTVDRKSAPMITFVRSGQARWVAVCLTDSGETDLLVRNSTAYTSTIPESTELADGSDLAHLNEWVTNLPIISHSDLFSVIEDNGKLPKPVRALPAEALAQIRSLHEQGERLSEIPTASFFNEAAKVLGLPEEVGSLVEAFELAPLADTFTELGGVTMTIVEPLPKKSLFKSMMDGITFASLHIAAKKQAQRSTKGLVGRLRTSDRFTQGAGITFITLSVLLCVYLVLALQFPALDEALGLTADGDWGIAWVLPGFAFLAGLNFVAMAGPQRRAKEYLRTARRDGVYPFDI